MASSNNWRLNTSDQSYIVGNQELQREVEKTRWIRNACKEEVAIIATAGVQVSPRMLWIISMQARITYSCIAV